MSTSSADLPGPDAAVPAAMEAGVGLCGLEQIRRVGGPVAVPWRLCCAFGLVDGALTCVLGEPPDLAIADDAVFAVAES